MKQLLYVITITGLLITGTACNTSAQTSKKNSEPAPAFLDSNKWEFTAVQVMPMAASPQYVSANYTVTCTKNKLVVYLPYFGRATSGIDVYSGRGPLDFKSTDFTIEKKQTKKGRWNITIKPNDYREVQNMYFTFYDDGTANLNISLSNRSPISFTGNVAAVAEKKQ